MKIALGILAVVLAEGLLLWKAVVALMAGKLLWASLWFVLTLLIVVLAVAIDPILSKIFKQALSRADFRFHGYIEENRGDDLARCT